MDVMITGYYYQIGNAPFETYCEAGKKIVFQMLVKSNRKIENVIIGYQVRDKYGNEVFGETSLTSGYPDIIIEEGESNTLGAVKRAFAIFKKGNRRLDVAAGNEGVSCGNPGKHSGHSGIVDDRHKPANVICVFFAAHSLGVVNSAADLLISCSHNGKGGGNNNHYKAGDDPGKHAVKGIVAGKLKHVLCLKEYSRSDYDTYYHANCGKQAVLFL
jgi:hypothetical protein